MDTIKIADIKIGNRRREDLGDIEALAESIRQYGLLAPPILTDDGTLVAGQRRVEAMKLLGWTETPYINKGQLTAERLHEIELEENIRRKDFTEYEISKNMVALAEVIRERLQTESEVIATPCRNNPLGEIPENVDQPAISDEGFSLTVSKNPMGGRPVKPNSKQAVADTIGVNRQTIDNARAHVNAVEAYPVLESLPKMKAISIAKQADKLPKEQRESFTEEQVAQLRQDFQEIDREADTAKKFIKALGAIREVKITRENVEAWVRFEKMNRDDIDEAHGDIRESISRLQALDKILSDLSTLRLAK